MTTTQVLVLMITSAGGLALTPQGCSSDKAKKAEAESAYTAEQLACVDRASTLEESKACREAVRAKWGVLDAGKDGTP